MDKLGYFRRCGIIRNSCAVKNNGNFETLGSKISNETPEEVACVRTT